MKMLLAFLDICKNDCVPEIFKMSVLLLKPSCHFLIFPASLKLW